MRRQTGFSLVLATAILFIIMLLTLVSLTLVNSNNALTRSVYSQSITLNAAESALHDAVPTMLDQAAEGFVNTLVEPSASAPYGGTLHSGQLNYTLIGVVDYEVMVRDNDDSDFDFTVDTDKKVILHAIGTMPSGGRTEIEVIVKVDDDVGEYDQETGGSDSDSAFSQETNTDGLGLPNN